jgi:hypothetical protein
VNRRLLVAVLVAAVAALLAGAAVGRNLLSSSSRALQPQADVVVFRDAVSGVSLEYPSDWTRIAPPGGDPDVALLATSGPSASLLMRVSSLGLAEVTRETLPVVRKLTDDLVAEDARAQQLSAPEAIELGGLPGYRYRYRYGRGRTGGAHVHYFLFKGGRMIQLVFQAEPAERLPEFDAVFTRIASTFRGEVR